MVGSTSIHKTLSRRFKVGPMQATDGIRDGRITMNSCFVSGSSPAEAWYVDLGAEYDIASVILSNRHTDGKFSLVIFVDRRLTSF